MRPAFACALLASLALLTPLASPALADDRWLPLDLGNRWIFENEVGVRDTFTCTGPGVFVDRMAYELSYSRGSFNSGLRNYWTLDADGSLLVHGFYSETGGYGRVYTPPIRLVSGTAQLSDAWSDTASVACIPGALCVPESVYSLVSVPEAGAFSLPVGTVTGIGVAITFLPVNPAPFAIGVSAAPLTRDLAGRRIAAAADGAQRAPPADVTRWAKGWGELEYQSLGDFRLVSLDGPTPALRRSWGALKRRYR